MKFFNETKEAEKPFSKEFTNTTKAFENTKSDVNEVNSKNDSNENGIKAFENAKADKDVEDTNKSDARETRDPIQNKADGLAREQEVNEELKEQYPPEQGYEILSEVYLRDKDGNIVKDPVTGKARRIDFVVIKDGKVVDSIEVTSKTADKTEQTAKENRIREAGGNYIYDRDSDRLIKIPDNVHTRIERRD